MKQTLAPDAKRLPVHLALLSAALARSIASIAFLPVTVVKTRFEALGASTPYSSTWGALRSIAATEGFRSLWSGLVPTVLRDVPHSALYYAMYNYTKSVLLPMRNPDSRIPIGVLNFTAGIISGLSATIFSHPFDVIRTRLQAQASLSSLGMVNMTLKILKVRSKQEFPFAKASPFPPFNLTIIASLHNFWYCIILSIIPYTGRRHEDLHQGLDASTHAKILVSCLHMDILRGASRLDASMKPYLFHPTPN
jgi:hypothetical protein